MTIEQIYQAHCAQKTAITPHLPRLRELAEGLDLAVEFGVKRGASSSSLLMGAKRVVSYDIAQTREALELKAAAGDRWDYRIEDTRTAAVPSAELLFVDSLHTADQVRAELVHADKISRFIVCHDILTFGDVGAVGETGRQAWQYVPDKGSCPPEHLGVRVAIDELMIRDDSWRIKARYNDSHGLLVLERR